MYAELPRPGQVNEPEDVLKMVIQRTYIDELRRNVLRTRSYLLEERP